MITKNDLKWLMHKVKADLSKKLDKPSSGIEVGKYFRVASIDELGNPVLEYCDAPQGVDVQINETSIVNDGVANIPITSDTQYGVSKTRSDQGIKLNSFGFLEPVQAPRNQYFRSSANLLVGITNLDYSVKEGLANSSLDWSDDEKKSAQSRLGIVQTTEEEYALLDSPSENTFYYTGDNIYLGSNQFKKKQSYKYYTEINIEEELINYEVTIPNIELNGYCITLSNSNNKIHPNGTQGGIYIQLYSSPQNMIQYINSVGDSKYYINTCNYKEKEKLYSFESKTQNGRYGSTQNTNSIFIADEKVILKRLLFAFQSTNQMQPGTKITIGLW